MIDVTLTAIAFLILWPIFWTVQVRTGRLSKHHFIQLGSLFLLGFLSLYIAVRLLTTQPTVWAIIISLILLFSAGFHLTLAFFKTTFEADGRYRRMYKAYRAVVGFDEPYEYITLRTDDGIKLKAVGLNNDPAQFDKAIVVCHGAGRSKNTMPIVQTCQILAMHYAVFALDFRGHMESNGMFAADGDTELDLKAMLEYVKQRGFKKVAVFGWSIGAWTALLSATLGRPIDAIIAGSPPPVDISTLSQIGLLHRYRHLGPLIRGGVSVIRHMRTKVGNHVMQIQDFASRLPAIPILLVYNEYDYTSKVDASVFEALYAKLPINSSEKLVLAGKGHLFDWPNTFLFWNKMLDWLKIKL